MTVTTTAVTVPSPTVHPGAVRRHEQTRLRVQEREQQAEQARKQARLAATRRMHQAAVKGQETEMWEAEQVCRLLNQLFAA